MPYVKQIERSGLDEVVNVMDVQGIAADGDLNYVLYSYCKRHISLSYNDIKNYCGELRQCATEIERRILTPYEDEKIEENGDII